VCVGFWPRARRAFLNFLGAITKLRKAAIRPVLFVRLSVRMEHPGSHWTDFNEIWYLIIFRKSVEKFLFWIHSDRNSCTYIYGNIWLNYSWIQKRFRQELYKKSKQAFFYFQYIFFRKSHRLWDNVKNMVQPDRPHMTI